MTAPLEFAQCYIEHGLSVHPLCGNKHQCTSSGKIPVDLSTGQHLASWQSHSMPSAEDIGQWRKSQVYDRANIGCLTGLVSGIIAIDLDGEEGVKMLFELAGDEKVTLSWHYLTGNGERLLYQYDPRVRNKTIKRESAVAHNQIDILTDGRQIVLPPSLHSNGRRYEWTRGSEPWNLPLAPAPQFIVDLTSEPARKPFECVDQSIYLDGAREGTRNKFMTSEIGWLMNRMRPGDDLRHIWMWVEAFNEMHMLPPIPEKELATVFRSITRREVRKGV